MADLIFTKGEFFKGILSLLKGTKIRTTDKIIYGITTNASTEIHEERDLVHENKMIFHNLYSRLCMCF